MRKLLYRYNNNIGNRERNRALSHFQNFTTAEQKTFGTAQRELVE